MVLWIKQGHRTVSCAEAACPGCEWTHRTPSGQPAYFRDKEPISEQEYSAALVALPSMHELVIAQRDSVLSAEGLIKTLAGAEWGPVDG